MHLPKVARSKYRRARPLSLELQDLATASPLVRHAHDADALGAQEASRASKAAFEAEATRSRRCRRHLRSVRQIAAAFEEGSGQATTHHAGVHGADARRWLMDATTARCPDGCPLGASVFCASRGAHTNRTSHPGCCRPSGSVWTHRNKTQSKRHSQPSVCASFYRAFHPRRALSAILAIGTSGWQTSL